MTVHDLIECWGDLRMAKHVEIVENTITAEGGFQHIENYNHFIRDDCNENYLEFLERIEKEFGEENCFLFYLIEDGGVQLRLDYHIV